MTPANDHKSNELHVRLLVVVVLIITGMLVTVGMSRLADSLGPQIGDIVSFLPSTVPSNSLASIVVHPATPSAHGACVLDVQVIQRFGGSLVIEAAHSKPDLQFQVHWAGLRTSHGEDDCGGSADLLVNGVDIGVLISAAGGRGAKAVLE